MSASNFAPTDRIVDIAIDDSEAAAPSPDLDQERRIAVFDLLEANALRVVAPALDGPYRLTVAATPNGVAFRLAGSDPKAPPIDVAPDARAVDDAVRDYVAVCAGYRAAVRDLTPGEIEQADRDRRECHGEAAEALRAALTPTIETSPDTARRLFTLVCAVRSADIL